MLGDQVLKLGLLASSDRLPFTLTWIVRVKGSFGWCVGKSVPSANLSSLTSTGESREAIAIICAAFGRFGRAARTDILALLSDTTLHTPSFLFTTHQFLKATYKGVCGFDVHASINNHRIPWSVV